tara:strand:+ start:57 stop:422 length:366 start_codon:yes stop_codon:yes gene_type:complete
MVSLLILLATAQASDVYEICVLKNQVWSEREQQFQTTNTTTYFSYEPLQFIIHDSSIELNRDKRVVSETFQQDDMQCWREHKNSFFCYDEQNKRFLWEFYKRNGEVTRDIMKPCVKNGKSI